MTGNADQSRGVRGTKEKEAAENWMRKQSVKNVMDIIVKTITGMEI